MSNRRTLLLSANQASTEVRDRTGYDEMSPVDAYDIAQQLGLNVLFVRISMEGIFLKKPPPPRIMLSSLRPLARRSFTCAHEIGHFVFGHGSTIDELHQKERQDPTQPDEILADGFASFLLMPALGIRSAFARRGTTAEQATPLEVLTVATEFGVGYETLVYHLGLMLRDITPARQAQLLKSSPKSIREDLIGASDATALSVIDAAFTSPAINLEIGHYIAAPTGTALSGNAISVVGEVAQYRILKAVRRGIATAVVNGKTVSLRVAPHQFAGRAIFRHMEDPDDE